jgi:hypothetical protein
MTDLGHKTGKRAGRGIGQWVAGGIVEGDIPALERSDDPSGQGTVWRNQRCGFLLFVRFAECNRDGQSFFL